MSAHTEGPWFCKFDDFDEELHITSAVLEASNMVEICRVGVGFDQPFEAEQQANARLIAAAPELLEAAKLAMEGDEVLGLLIAAIKKHGNYSQMSTIHFLNQARCARLRLTEAIAKAEGTP